jgi:hypothetical protein
MNYVDETRVEEIQLLVFPFEGDGASRFSVPVNGDWVPVEYRAQNGKHQVSVEPSSTKFTVQILGIDDLQTNLAPNTK